MKKPKSFFKMSPSKYYKAATLAFLVLVAVLFQNFTNTTTASPVSYNGFALSWDSRFSVLATKEESNFTVCLFRPQRSSVTIVNSFYRLLNVVNAFSPSSFVDTNGDAVADSSDYCIPLLKGDPSFVEAFSRVPKFDSNGNYSFNTNPYNPAVDDPYMSVIYHMNAVTVAPFGENALAMPFNSDENGVASSSGAYSTYDFYVYTQVYNHLSLPGYNNYSNQIPHAKNPITGSLPNSTIGRMRFKLVVQNFGLSSAKIRNIIRVQDWQKITTPTGGLISDSIEPSVTADGRLLVYQINGKIMYSINANPATLSGWTAPANITNLYSQRNTLIAGQSIAQRYALARQPIKSNLGQAYVSTESLWGAYPWISWEGSDLMITSATAFNNSTRAAWTIVGESTGNQMRLIDSGLRDFADVQLGLAGSTSLVTMSSGIAHSSSIWNPFREYDNAVFPQVGERPSIAVMATRNVVTEISLKGFADGNYLTYLEMNRSLKKMTGENHSAILVGGNTNTDAQYELDKTPDISGKNNFGVLRNNASIPFRSRADQTAFDFYGQQVLLKSNSYVEVAHPVASFNPSQFSVEMMVKPMVDLSDVSTATNNWVTLFYFPGVMNITLEESRKLTVRLFSPQHANGAYFSGFITTNFEVNKWSHLGVTFNESTGRLQVYLDAVDVFDQIVLAGTKVVGSSGLMFVGPYLKGSSLTDLSTDILAIDQFKFSTKVRSADEFADSAHIPRQNRNLPALTLDSAISPLDLRVMNMPYRGDVAQLGSLLFRDKRLSGPKTISCATCHDPSKAFTDGQTLRVGLQGTALAFNSPTLVNRGVGRYQTWAGEFSSVGEQAWLPLSHPNEMNLSVANVVNFLNTQSDYKARFLSVFGKNPDIQSVQEALHVFVSSIVSSKSKFDRIQDNEVGLSYTADELSGKQIFFGKARCAACHNGVNFSDDQFHNTGIFTSGTFGLGDHSGRTFDNRKIKTPTLRNLSLTAPYFHDGSSADLLSVINRYIAASNTSDTLKSSEMQTIALTATEKNQLIAFLSTLESPVTFAFSVDMSEALPGLAPTVPSTPTNVSAVRGNASALVSFSAPSSNGNSAIIDYQISAFADGATTAAVVKSNVTTLSDVSVTGLVNGTPYTFKIRARNAIGLSAYSAASSAIIPGTTPTAPTIGTPTAIASGARVAFVASINTGGYSVTSFEVLVYENGSATSSQTFTGTVSPISVNGLSPSLSYKFRVRSRNAIGLSALSAESAAVVPLAGAPGAPTSVAAVRGNASAVVSFSAPASNGGSAVIDYEVSSYLNGATAAAAVKTAVLGSPVTITSLINGGSYTFKVRARNATGYGAYSTSSVAVVPATVPTAPVMGSVVSGSGSVTVNFSAPSSTGGESIDLYEVQAFVSGVLNSSRTTTAAPFVYSSLTNGTSYTFKVRAKNAVGYGPISASSAAVSPKAPLLPNLNFANGSLVLSGGGTKVASNLTLAYETNGNLVVRSSAGTLLWQTGTTGRTCTSGCTANFQSDGNLVLYQGATAYWQSGSISSSTYGSTLKIVTTAPYVTIVEGKYNVTVWSSQDTTTSSFSLAKGQFMLWDGGSRTMGSVKVSVLKTGVMVVQNLSNQILWTSGTISRSCNFDCSVIFQNDGNLVLYQGSTPYWSTATNPSGTTIQFLNVSPFIQIKDSGGTIIFPVAPPDPDEPSNGGY